VFALDLRLEPNPSPLKREFIELIRSETGVRYAGGTIGEGEGERCDLVITVPPFRRAGVSQRFLSLVLGVGVGVWGLEGGVLYAAGAEY